MGLSRTVFPRYTAISVENCKIFPPLYSPPPLTGFRLELGIGPEFRKKTGMMGLLDGPKRFETGLAV